MVYGLGTKTEHGYTVNVEMLDGSPAAIRSINQEPDGGVSFRGFTSGRRCHTEEFPTKMCWMGPLNPPIPDFNQSTLLNVSERGRDFIKSIEPSVHQFVPVDYFDKANNCVERRYFWVICNRIDSVDREYTTMVLRNGKTWRSAQDLHDRGQLEEISSHIDLKIPSKFVFNLNQIGDVQVWRDKHMDLGDILVSNTFAEALKQSELTGFKLSDELGEI